MTNKDVFRLVVFFIVILGLVACNRKHSAVEGKLVDWNNKPVASVKITASQIQPIKGYEQVETITKSDGTFKLDGLFPSSAYVLKPWSSKWTCETASKFDSAPQGETGTLIIKIDRALSMNSGSMVKDLATGEKRFSVSTDEVITDSQTGLQWIIGSDYDINNTLIAEQWAATCSRAGGGWRIPTREELVTLYQKGLGQRNMDPVFKQTGWQVFYKQTDMRLFNFRSGNERWSNGDTFSPRVFGVRKIDHK